MGIVTITLNQWRVLIKNEGIVGQNGNTVSGLGSILDTLLGTLSPPVVIPWVINQSKHHCVVIQNQRENKPNNQGMAEKHQPTFTCEFLPFSILAITLENK